MAPAALAGSCLRAGLGAEEGAPTLQGVFCLREQASQPVFLGGALCAPLPWLHSSLPRRKGREQTAEGGEQDRGEAVGRGQVPLLEGQCPAQTGPGSSARLPALWPAVGRLQAGTMFPRVPAVPELVLEVMHPAQSCPWMGWELRGCLEGRPGCVPPTSSSDLRC